MPVMAKSVFTDYDNIRWNTTYCKRCMICVEVCPVDALALTNDMVKELESRCVRCGMCERYCPDMAIQVLPSGQAAKERVNT